MEVRPVTLHEMFQMGVRKYVAAPTYDISRWEILDRMPDINTYHRYLAIHPTIMALSKYDWFDAVHCCRLREQHGPILKYYEQRLREPDSDSDDWWQEYRLPVAQQDDLEYFTDGSENGVWA